MCVNIKDELSSFFLKTSLYREKYINKLNEQILLQKKNMKKLAIKNFEKHIKNDNSLYLLDEKILEIYKFIIKNYEKFLEKTKKIKENFNEDTKKNIDGIAAVLESQIKFFYETNADENINPIFIEKKKILKKYKYKICKDIDYIIKKASDNSCYKESILEIYINIQKCYKNNVIQFFNIINDTENREKMSLYSDVLEEEMQILSSIIKVQIMALENQCNSEEEKQNMLSLLEPIREAYQHTNKKFDDLLLKIKTIDPMLNIDFLQDEKDIKLFVKGAINGIEKVEKNEKKVYIACIKEYISIFLLEKEKDMKKNTQKYEHFAKEIKNIFKNLSEYIYNTKNEIKKGKSLDIVDGIYESLCIKIENMAEKYEDMPNAKNIYSEIEKCMPKIEKDNMLDNTLEKYTIDESFYNKNAIEMISNNSNLFKNMKSIIDSYENSINDYVKNTILFEISTFYEILYYSVARLRDDSDINIKNIVLKIDTAENDIEKELNMYDIELIKPVPKNKFDAKEQEIIMAEKAEGFLKGEIIKAISYGYKSNKNVIKRATIIAAK